MSEKKDITGKLVKVRFKWPHCTERIWVKNVKASGSGYKGSLSNEPVCTSAKKWGDTVSFSKSQVVGVWGASDSAVMLVSGLAVGGIAVGGIYLLGKWMGIWGKKEETTP